MEKIIKRIILRLFPELSAGLHLPIFGEVVSVREEPRDGDICDEFRPYYAVDVQLLDQYGKPDNTYPLYRDVVLPLPVTGHEKGFFCFPEPGTVVEIAFAYGSPNKPFIRCIIPAGRSLPGLDLGEQLFQISPSSYQKADAAGSWERITDQAINEYSFKRTIASTINEETTTDSIKRTLVNDVHDIGAALIKKAMGMIQFLSGGRFDIGAINDLTLTTKSNLKLHSDNEVVSNANVKQKHIAPRSWVGSDAENMFIIQSELKQAIIDLCTILETHTHPGVGAPVQAPDILAISNQINAIKARLDGITEQTL